MSVGAIENEYLRRHPGEAADLIDRLPMDSLPGDLEGLDPSPLALTLDYLSPVKAAAIFKLLPAVQQVELLETASPRLTIALLGELETDESEALLSQLTPAVREDITRLASFPENSAGRLMDRLFRGYPEDMSVAEALKRLRESDIRRARSLYLVGTDNTLIGRVDMQDLAFAEPEAKLGEYLHPIEDCVDAMAPREEVVKLLDRYRLDSIPVVDTEGKLMGVVRYTSLFQAIEDVATADLQKMVGVSADERALSTAGFSVRRRLPWLHINLLTAFLAASVVGLFENLIAQFTALAVLLPVVAGQSGNAGSQALAVTIRGLALKEIGIRQWRAVLNKELMVGIVNGTALAITCGLGVFLWSSSFGLSVVIAVAMVLSMVAAGISGALVPMLLTRIGQDPATASSIILTTVTDVAGFFSFLGTATLLSFML